MQIVVKGGWQFPTWPPNAPPPTRKQYLWLSCTHPWPYVPMCHVPFASHYQTGPIELHIIRYILSVECRKEDILLILSNCNHEQDLVGSQGTMENETYRCCVCFVKLVEDAACLRIDRLQLVSRMLLCLLLLCSEQPKRKSKRAFNSYIIALYPVRWTSQSHLYFTPSQTCSFRHQ